MLRWSPGASACVVASSSGYPGSYKTGLPIAGLGSAAQVPGVQVFHSGTPRVGGQLVTSGGRVLGVTAAAESCARPSPAPTRPWPKFNLKASITGATSATAPSGKRPSAKRRTQPGNRAQPGKQQPAAGSSLPIENPARRNVTRRLRSAAAPAGRRSSQLETPRENQP